MVISNWQLQVQGNIFSDEFINFLMTFNIFFSRIENTLNERFCVGRRKLAPKFFLNWE